MKKLCIALLAAVLLIFPAACSDKTDNGGVDASSAISAPSSAAQDGMALYKAGAEKIDAAMREGSLKYQYTSNVAFTSAGVTQNMGISGDMVMSWKDGLQISMTTDMTMGSSDTVIQSALYSDGKTIYSSAMGQTVKQTLDQATTTQLEERIFGQAGTAANLENASVLEQTVTEEAEGGYTVTLTLDPASLSDVSGLLDGVTDMAQVEYQINTMTLTAKLDQTGMLTSVEADADLDMTQNGQEINVGVRYSTSYSDVGGDFTITPPDSIDMENAVETESIFGEA